MKDGVNVHTCTMKGCPGYLVGDNTRLDFKNGSRHRPYSSAMLSEALTEGPFCGYSLETMMMEHEGIEKQRKHRASKCTHKYGSDPGQGSKSAVWDGAQRNTVLLTRVNFDYHGKAKKTTTNSISWPMRQTGTASLPSAAQTTIGVSRGWPHVDTFG